MLPLTNMFSYNNILPNLVLNFIILSVLSICVLKWFTRIKSETILLVKDVGLQSTITYTNGHELSNFIPWNCIEDIIINEVFEFQKVIYILVVLAKNYQNQSTSVIPLLQNTKPRLATLEEIYKNCQQLLHCDNLNPIYKIEFAKNV